VLNDAENVYQLYGSDLSVLAPWGTFASEVLGAKTAAVVYDDVPGGNTGGEAIRDGLEAAGIEVTAVGIPLNSPDLLGPITAAGGQDADVLVPVMGPTGCINMAKALDQIGSETPVVSIPLCLIGPVAEALGDTPQWYYGIAQSLPSDPNAPDSVVYLETSGEYGLPPEQAYGPFAALGWATVLELVKFMNEIGPDNVTPEAISAAIEAFRGPLIMGAPDVECGLFPPTPSACANQTKFYDYEGQGAFVAASDWLRPPGE
jgi:branched-chain amino acid transport system substrate-binding protein